jgi:hypothetical protein
MELTGEEILNRLDKLQLELEEAQKNKTPILVDNLLLLIKLGSMNLAERENSYGINYKSGLRAIAENLIKDMENGKKLNIIY